MSEKNVCHMGNETHDLVTNCLAHRSTTLYHYAKLPNLKNIYMQLSMSSKILFLGDDHIVDLIMQYMLARSGVITTPWSNHSYESFEYAAVQLFFPYHEVTHLILIANVTNWLDSDDISYHTLL